MGLFFLSSVTKFTSFDISLLIFMIDSSNLFLCCLRAFNLSSAILCLSFSNVILSISICILSVSKAHCACSASFISFSISSANCSSSVESPKDNLLFGVSYSFSGTSCLGLLSKKSVPEISFSFCMGSLKSFLVDSARGTLSLLSNV